MTDDELTLFKQQLLQQRDTLMASQQLGQSATETVELDQSSVGRVSRIDAMQSQSMAIETARLRQQQLRQIITALALIESGDYGFCVECDTEIDVNRLAIDSAATRCVACASRLE
jgi:DnaK suppressor protein